MSMYMLDMCKLKRRTNVYPFKSSEYTPVHSKQMCEQLTRAVHLPTSPSCRLSKQKLRTPTPTFGQGHACAYANTVNKKDTTALFANSLREVNDFHIIIVNLHVCSLLRYDTVQKSREQMYE